MSADNGIYIGRFPTAAGEVEYRVIEAAAIDNVDYGDTQMQDAYRALYFGGKEVKVFSSKIEAGLYALEWSDDFYILEYGISHLTFDRPLVPMTQEEIKEVLVSHRRTSCQE